MRWFPAGWTAPPSLDTLTRMWVVGSLFAGINLVVMQIARVLLWVCHTEPTRLPGWAILGPAMIQGAFNDVAVNAVLVLTWTVLFSPALLAPSRYRPVVMRLFTGSLAALTVALALMSAVEFYYYEFYHSRFDSLMFGLVEYGSGDVLGSIWATYPVIKALVATVVGWWLVKRFFAWAQKAWLGRCGAGALTIGGVVGFSVAGVVALGVFSPHRWIQHRITVDTRDPLGMTLAWNSPQSFVRALSLYRNELYLNPDPRTDLQALGFPTLESAAQAAGLKGKAPEEVAREMFPRAPGTPIARHPNVVLGLMESFGADLMDTDGPGNDMLGRLRSHLVSDDVFTHFYAGQNATHPEIENLLLGSPITPLTLNPKHDVPLPTSAAWPFRLAGYRTIFIYSGRRTRQNLDQVLRRQGFDEVYAKSDLERRFPHAGHTSWGVYDAYLFQYIQEVIDRESTPERPVFIFFLTTTNHPPYVLDTPHRDLPVDPRAMGSRGNRDMDLRRRILKTYQYQADQLGGFLDTLEHGPHGQDTVVAVAGDHNIHEHFQYRLPEETPDTDRVFALMHVPPSYRPQNPVDHTRWASHKDLVPTLVHLALPGHPYFATGHSLFAPAQPSDVAVSRFNQVYDSTGMITGLRAQEAQFYPWTRVGSRVVGTGRSLTPSQAAQLQPVAARVALRGWFIRAYLFNRAEIKWDWRWLGFPTKDGPSSPAN